MSKIKTREKGKDINDEEYAALVLNFDTIGGAIEFRYSTAQIKDEAIQKGPER